jgi:uncharacterized protein (DUF488 family)
MTKHLPVIYTIGHSNLPIVSFLDLLKEAGIEAIADVRSVPWSRFNPQFNKDTLKEQLRASAIEYSFLGDELGGRPKEYGYYSDGVADYQKMAKAPHLRAGLDRLERGAEKYRIALLCSEQDPLDCHRCLLVGRALHERGHPVHHLRHDGSIQTQAEVEEELLWRAGQDTADLFAPHEQQLDAAYRRQNRRAAYSEASQSADTVAAE